METNQSMDWKKGGKEMNYVWFRRIQQESYSNKINERDKLVEVCKEVINENGNKRLIDSLLLKITALNVRLGVASINGLETDY